MRTVGKGAGARGGPGATAKGGRGRRTCGGWSTREESDQGTLPDPKLWSTAGCSAPAAAAVLRRVRVKIRPEGVNATEASEEGVGVGGCNFGGVAPKGTRKPE